MMLYDDIAQGRAPVPTEAERQQLLEAACRLGDDWPDRVTQGLRWALQLREAYNRARETRA